MNMRRLVGAVIGWLRVCVLVGRRVIWTGWRVCFTSTKDGDMIVKIIIIYVIIGLVRFIWKINYNVSICRYAAKCIKCNRRPSMSGVKEHIEDVETSDFDDKYVSRFFYPVDIPLYVFIIVCFVFGPE